MNEEIKNASEFVRDPASISVTTYVWVVVLATMGGIVRVVREVELGDKSWKKILMIFLVEIFVSIFAGVVTFFLCQSNNVQPFYTAVMTSLAGYMGGRALTMLEAVYKAMCGKGE